MVQWRHAVEQDQTEGYGHSIYCFRNLVSGADFVFYCGGRKKNEKNGRTYDDVRPDNNGYRRDRVEKNIVTIQVPPLKSVFGGELIIHFQQSRAVCP